MRRPVQAYFLVISAMTALAAQSAGQAVRRSLPRARSLSRFYISVARDRFVRQQFANRAWGLPLYYLAQVLLP